MSERSAQRRTVMVLGSSAAGVSGAALLAIDHVHGSQLVALVVVYGVVMLALFGYVLTQMLKQRRRQKARQGAQQGSQTGRRAR